MNKPKNTDKAARRAAYHAEVERWETERRGFNRGASRGWLARSNRKLSRIAARN